MTGKIRGHRIRGKDYWQSHLQRLHAIMQTMSEQQTQDLRLRAELEREAGLVQEFLGVHGEENLVASCRKGAALALLRMLQKRSDAFEVEIRQPYEVVRLTGETPVDFGWPHWLDAFSLAILLDMGEALTVLSTADCIDACAMPMQQADRFWPFLCGAFATLATKDPNALGLIDDAEHFLQETGFMPQAMASAIYLPLLKVMRAIIKPDQRAFTVAIKKGLEGFHGYYSSIDDGEAEIGGLYHLTLSAIIAIGLESGLRLNVESDAILKPTRDHDQVDAPILVAVYPPLAIYDALEAAWFLELEGFRSKYSSEIYQEDNELYASYFAPDGSRIPNGEFVFRLLGEGDNPYSIGALQPPLDVGQLLSIAESLSSNPIKTESGEERYLLDEAVTAVDLALKYIQWMNGRFDPGTLHSQVGRALYEAEPGRFDQKRLLVYRNALSEQTGDTATVMPESDATRLPEASTKEQVFAMIEALKPYLLPILQSIASEDNSEVVKSLRPLPEDYEKVFDEKLAAVAKKHYAGWWKHQDLHVRADSNTRIDAHMAPAGMLGEENELSRNFPGGYRLIAAYLNPHRIWTSWKYYQEGERGGLSMNGLVWVDDHWAWFPKPYKLTDYLEPGGGVAQIRH